jgi:hypothetical protein
MLVRVGGLMVHPEDLAMALGQSTLVDLTAAVAAALVGQTVAVAPAAQVIPAALVAPATLVVPN